MTEQYIYSRSEREFTNARNQTVSLGFGFVALSPGMDDALKRDAAVHCEDCPRLFQRDGRESGLPLLRKVRLAKGRVLLQKSAWIEDSSRDFHVAHGYVLEDGTLREAGPARWLALPFQLGDPNGVKDGVLLDSLPELPDQASFEPCGLRSAALGLDKDSFCQLLLACFDALAARRQVLIACNLEEPEAWRLRLSALYWIYSCLPGGLRTDLGFDSAYTEKSSPGQVHLAFVDRSSIQGDGRERGIRLGNHLIPLGGNFLVLDGAILHNDGKYKTDWYGKDGVYACWLKRIVDVLWDSPDEMRESAAGELEKIQRSLQRQLDRTPEEKRLDPQVFGSACGRIPAPEDLEKACRRTKIVHAESRREPSPAEISGPDRSEQSDAQRDHITQSNLQPDHVTQSSMQPDLKDVQSLPAAQDVSVEQWLEQCERIAAERSSVKDVRAYIRNSFRKLPVVGEEQRRSMEKELWQQLFVWVFRRRTASIDPKSIKLLAAMCGGWAEYSATGLLGVIAAECADKPAKTVKLGSVLRLYQEMLPPDAYARVLRGLFWNEPEDRELVIWNGCRTKHSETAAKRRRGAWYREVVTAYRPGEDIAACVNRSLGVLSGIGEAYLGDMEQELQEMIQTNQRLLNGGSGVLK